MMLRWFWIFLLVSPSAWAMDVEMHPQIAQVFTIDDCEDTPSPLAIRCTFSAKLLQGKPMRIRAYSLKMEFWQGKEKVSQQSIPNGDMDSGDQYRHLLAAPKRFNKLVVDFHPPQVSPKSQNSEAP